MVLRPLSSAFTPGYPRKLVDIGTITGSGETVPVYIENWILSPRGEMRAPNSASDIFRRNNRCSTDEPIGDEPTEHAAKSSASASALIRNENWAAWRITGYQRGNARRQVGSTCFRISASSSRFR